MFSYPPGKGPKERLNGDSIRKRRGRPPKRDRELITIKSIRVTPYIEAVLEEWKREFHAKTYDEAIRRHLGNKVQKIARLQKKVDAQDVEILGLQQKLKVLNVQHDSLIRIKNRQETTVLNLEQRVRETELILEVENR